MTFTRLHHVGVVADLEAVAAEFEELPRVRWAAR
jgi:hypothetical protein